MPCFLPLDERTTGNTTGNTTSNPSNTTRNVYQNWQLSQTNTRVPGLTNPVSNRKAFFFAKGFVQTGLGDRVATFFVKTMGKSTLGLAYGLSISEALLAPAMPSTTARAGGVYLPIIKSLAKNAGSEPGPTANKLGAFLIQNQLQCSGHSSAMCMTAAAQNLLSLKLAASLGIIIASPWLTWFKAACVPAIVGLAVTPLLVFKLMPPEIQDTPNAPIEAAAKLTAMGPLSQDETMVCVTMGITVILWIFGDAIGMSSVTAAMLGMSLQLFTGVITWADCLNEKGAWDTLVWFAVLIGMSAQLNNMGFIGFLSDSVAGALGKTAMGWQQTFVLLHACYFAVHYLFASQTAQVAALSTAFMAMMIASGKYFPITTFRLPDCPYTTDISFISIRRAADVSRPDDGVSHQPVRRHNALRLGYVFFFFCDLTVCLCTNHTNYPATPNRTHDLYDTSIDTNHLTLLPNFTSDCFPTGPENT